MNLNKFRQISINFKDQGSFGFTLIEMLVAMSVFSVVLTISLGIFIYTINIQNKSNIMRSTQQNAKFAIEEIKRNSRLASHITIEVSGLDLDRITFTVESGETSYYINGQGALTKRNTDGTTTILTSDEVFVSKLKFNASGLDNRVIEIIAAVREKSNSASGYEKDTTEIKTSITFTVASGPPPLPEPPVIVTYASVLSGGEEHSLTLKTDGTVWAWGWNLSGQLGNGDSSHQNSLVPVQVLGGATGEEYLGDIRAVAAGQLHSLALKNDGTVWAWGNGFAGCLGDGLGSYSDVPIQVVDPSDPTGKLTNIIAITAGNYNSLALKNNGTVWAWGNNSRGQLGDGTTTNRNAPVQVVDPSDPTGKLTNVIAISTRWKHSLALKSNGTVWAWGDNTSGQLGNKSYSTSYTPVQVKDSADTGLLKDIKAITAGGENSLALKSDGSVVWAWGEQYGYIPKQVKGQDGIGFLTDVTAIIGGTYYDLSDHFLALKNNNTVWAWGVNDSGELGDNTNITKWNPVQVLGPGGSGVLENISDIGAGGVHSLALKDGTVWAWGWNGSGALGDGTGVTSWVPVQTKNF